MGILQPGFISPGRKRPHRRSGATVKVKVEAPKREFNTAVIWKSLMAVMLVAAAGFGVMNAQKMIDAVSSQRVEQVIIEGDINYVSERDVLQAVNSFISESLVTVDMGEIKNELERMPWIRSVSIRREWPDTMVLGVTEEKAIARWGDTQLLNQDGAIFSPANISGLENLAVLSGPEGSERKVMEQYQLFNQLLYQHGLRIAELSLNSRGAWKLMLANGVKVSIGKTRVMEKMRRLVSFIDPVFMEQMGDIESIDLRYTSGIAVKTKQTTNGEVVSL